MKAFVRPGAKFAVVTSDNTKTKPWRQEIAGCCAETMQQIGMQQIPRDNGVRVEVFYYFAKPKSTKKSKTQKTTKPDLDKCDRSVLDALTGIAFVDDAQVTQLWVSKFFDAQPRAEIRVTDLGE